MQQALVYGFVAGSVYALTGLGFALIFSAVRFFNFGHGAVFVAGAYLNYALYVRVGLPLWLSATLAVGAAAMLGLAFEFFVFAPLRGRGASSLVLLIASLGLLVAAQNLIALVFGSDTKSVRSAEVVEGVNVLGARVTSIQGVIVVVSVVLFVLVGLLLSRTRIGRSIRATANDMDLAEVKGIPTARVIRSTFILGSALGAAAGILVSLDVDMDPTMGFSALLFAVASVIVGGLGNILGAYIGGLFLGIVQHLGVWFGRSEWQDAIVFGVLIFFLLFRPAGFFGKRPQRPGG